MDIQSETGQECHGLNFPKDHLSHDAQGEWWYFWGHLSNDTFFHFTRFANKIGGLRVGSAHFSIHNHESKYFEEYIDELGISESRAGFVPGRKGNQDRFYLQFKKMFWLACYPESRPVVHDVTHNRNYYSVPYLKADGYFAPAEKVTGDVWFDHEFSKLNRVKGWDWVSLKLDSGLWILVYDCDIDRFCSVGLNGNIVKSEFVLEGDTLKVFDLGMQFKMVPTVEEKAFDPQFGMTYSETPFHIYSSTGGKKLGFGIRERTGDKLMLSCKSEGGKDGINGN